MTNREVWQAAMEQSALDINCDPSDFLSGEHVIVKSCVGPAARKYYKEPIACNLVSYGNNIVASVRDEYREIVREYIEKFEWYHCFETPNMHWLNARLWEKGQKVCFMAEYFLPDMAKLRPLSCKYELGILDSGDLGIYMYPNGETLCVRTGRNWMCWGLGRMTADGLWALRDVLPIVTPCGRLAWTCCRNIEGRG